jgi:hypothetical protein
MKKYILNISLMAGIFFLYSGCERSIDPDDHEDMEKVILLDRTQSTRTILATWTHDDGWDISMLPPLAVGGGRMELDIEVYNDHDEILLLDGSEYYIQYSISDGAAAGVIDVTRNDLFHGSYVYIYPLAIGTTQVEFALWHANHPDAYTSPITVSVIQ